MIDMTPTTLLRASTGLSLTGLCLFCLLLFTPGCNPPAPKAQNANSQDSNDSETDQEDPDCNSYIDNAISMLEPDRLGISSSLERAVGLLNQWTFKCGNFDSKPPKVTDSQKPFLKKYLNEDQLAKMDLTRFTEYDGKFIRDSQLFNGMVSAAIKEKKNDVDRTTAAFYYCMNNVALIADEKYALPLSPYEICVIGIGTAEQRAWVFIDLMRQLRIDAVIIRPAKPAPYKLLVGVLLEDKVYLYDPILGLPVPAAEQPEDAFLIQNPATFSEVQKSPDLLKNFYGSDAKNRFSAEELKTARIEIIGRSSEWSARMRRLEDSLSRKQTFVLYRNLDPFEGDPGFIAHIQSVGKGMFKDSPIQVSEYADQQMNETEAVTGEQAQRLTLLKLPFRAPIPYDKQLREETPQGMFKVKWGAPTRKLLKTRTEQLMGNQQTAVESYVITRLEERFPVDLIVPKEVREIHIMAGHNASYFLALGQYLQQEYSSASQTFDFFLRLPLMHRNSDGVLMGRSLAALYMMTISYAESDKLNLAIFTLSENMRHCPDALKPAFEYLNQRWKQIREKNKK